MYNDIQSNLNSSNTDDSFTMDNSNSFFESLQNSSEISRNQIFRDFFLILPRNCMLCVLIRIASSRRFLWVDTIYNCGINDRKISPNHRHLHPDLAPWLTLSGSNYPCLEQFSMVSKMFEPLKFDCDKTYDNTCVTGKDSDQPVHPPSMARVLVYPSLDSPGAVEGTCDQRRLIRLRDLSLHLSHKSDCRFCRALA